MPAFENVIVVLVYYYVQINNVQFFFYSDVWIMSVMVVVICHLVSLKTVEITLLKASFVMVPD